MKEGSRRSSGASGKKKKTSGIGPRSRKGTKRTSGPVVGVCKTTPVAKGKKKNCWGDAFFFFLFCGVVCWWVGETGWGRNTGGGGWGKK